MTEQSNDRQLRLAGPGDWPAKRIVELSTHIATGSDFTDSVQLIHEAIGEEIPQGSLFAYLFRRFGFPNAGSDDFKELCRYFLTTTHPGMIMSIVPYSGGDSSISISFMVSHETRADCEEWYQRSRNARDQRFIEWIEKQGRIPEWADNFFVELQEKGWPVPEGVSGWSRIMPSLAMLTYHHDKNTTSKTLLPKELVWYQSVKEDYAKVDTDGDPGLDYRDPDWRNWDDEDPMKPYAKAIHDTLQELKRPVWIRDCAINAWGPCEEPDEEHDEEEVGGEGKPLQSADYADSAGYPCGALGNADPKGFAELHNEILEAGEGDPVKGIEITRTALTMRNGEVSSWPGVKEVAGCDPQALARIAITAGSDDADYQEGQRNPDDDAFWERVRANADRIAQWTISGLGITGKAI